MARIRSSRDAVSVEGLAELRKALGQIEKQLPKHLRTRLKVVADHVAEDARSRVPVGRDRKGHKGGTARASVKSGVSGNVAYVQEGRATVPYMGWLDFGGVLKPVGKRKNTITRDRPRGGRFLYPAIAANKDRIAEEATQAFEETARELGLK